jgi:hypothetical protein
MTKTDPKTDLAKPQEELWKTRSFREAMGRGDVRGVIAAALQHHPGDPLAARGAALEDLARFAVEIRRQNVDVLGSHDAFVRRTEHGELQQVVRPVTLSLANDTLYQLPVFGKYRPGTNVPAEGDERGEWKACIPEHARYKATITAFGLNEVNKVAGCAIGQPDVVVVDGVPRTNPYTERAILPNGRIGDIVRVVVRVNVVGPAPATGNPVIIQYTLDVDPGKDLQHMLLNKARENAADIFLLDEDGWSSFREDQKQPGRWKFLPLYGGVGIVHNLAHNDVRQAYTKYVNLLQNALKKAQTVARRNAMRAHPALAFQTVTIDATGRAIVPVVGWVSSDRNMGRYMQLLDRMARGLLPDLAEVDASIVTLDESYDPEQHATGRPSEDAVVDEVMETDPRNGVVEQIEAGLNLLSPSQIADLAYDAEADLEALQAVLARMNAMLDGAP